MTDNEANQCLLVMILFDRRDWPAAQVAAWTQAIQKCTDVRAAGMASDALVHEYDPRDWSLHRWHQAYQSALIRISPPPTPIDRGPVMSLTTYLGILARRAEAGDEVAAAELAVWEKHRNGPYVRALEAS